MEQQDITRRIDRLERSNRQLRIGLCVVGMVLCFVLFAGAVPSEQFIPTIKTNKLEVLDKDGEVRISLDVTGEGAYVALRGSTPTQPTAQLTATSKAAGVLLTGDEATGGKVGLSVGEGGKSMLTMSKKSVVDGKSQFCGFDVMANSPDIGTTLHIVDSNHGLRAKLGVDTSGESILALCDRDGKKRAEMSVFRDGITMLSVNGADEKVRIGIGTLPEMPPCMFITDIEGNDLWSAP